MEIADEVTIIRDGAWISSGPISDYTSDKIISLMVGRKISNIFPKEKAPIGDTVLEVRELCSRGVFRNISFSVKEGEILGFAGLVGAGRSEVMRAVFGLDEYQSGEIFVNGKKAEIHRTEDAIAGRNRHGIRRSKSGGNHPYSFRERKYYAAVYKKIQETWSYQQKSGKQNGGKND